MVEKAESRSQDSKIEGKQLNIRLSGKLYAEVDAYKLEIQQMVPAGIKITISDAIRALIELGLEAVESRKHSGG